MKLIHASASARPALALSQGLATSNKGALGMDINLKNLVLSVS